MSSEQLIAQCLSCHHKMNITAKDPGLLCPECGGRTSQYVSRMLSPEELAKYGPPNKSDQVIDRNTIAPKNQDGEPKKAPFDIPKNTAAERDRRRAMREENEMIELSKEQYMQLRLNGMNRTDIMKRHFKGQTTPFYRQLQAWGIREKDAEDRELELMAPIMPKAEPEPMVLEGIEDTVDSDPDQEGKTAGAETAETTQETAHSEEVGETFITELEWRPSTLEERIERLEHEQAMQYDWIKRVANAIDKHGIDVPLDVEEAAPEVTTIVTNQDDTYITAPESKVAAYGYPELQVIQPRRSRRTMRIEITDTKAVIEDELQAILAYVQAMRGETFTLELSLGEVKTG